MNIHRLYHPFLRYFRTKRMQYFYRHFGITNQTRILDIGGDFFNWSLVSNTPVLTIMNLYSPTDTKSNICWVIADGRHAPFKDNAFDIAYSNSVIEHLGNFANQQAFARETRRVATRYYIQTPNKRFPIEPHLITPFIHWLPRAVQRRMLKNFTVWGLVTRPTRQKCEDYMREIWLLDEPQLKRLFPDAKIWRERMCGLLKSLIAIRDSN